MAAVNTEISVQDETTTSFVSQNFNDFVLTTTLVNEVSNDDDLLETTSLDSYSFETTPASMVSINDFQFQGVFVSSESERILTLIYIIIASLWIIIANGSIMWIRYVSDKLNQEYHYMLSICAFFNIMLVIPGKYQNIILINVLFILLNLYKKEVRNSLEFI